MMTFQEIREQVREQLVPYGQYFILKDVPTGVQPFHLVDLGIPALAVVGWAVKEYVSGYIRAKAQKAANSRTSAEIQRLQRAYDDLDQRVSAATKKMEDIEKTLQEVVAVCQATGIAGLQAYQIDEAALSRFMVEFGLTHRRASQCATALLPFLEIEVPAMLEKLPDDTTDNRGDVQIR